MVNGVTPPQPPPRAAQVKGAGKATATASCGDLARAAPAHVVSCALVPVLSALPAAAASSHIEALKPFDEMESRARGRTNDTPVPRCHTQRHARTDTTTTQIFAANDDR